LHAALSNGKGTVIRNDILHELKEIKKWVFDAHEHHNSSLCAEDAFPYVNSLEIEVKLDKLIAWLEAEQ
jgi:hypothetical protein